LFSISILEGLNGVYFLLAILVALVGLLAGHRLILDLVQRLVKTNTKLERLYNQQAAFVGNVAHEFRSPLAVFKGMLDNLADGLHGPLTQDQAEPVASCRKEVNRLARLVSDLLDVTRIEAGKLPLAQQDVILQDVLNSVAQLFSGLLRERGLSLTMDLPDAPAVLIGDRDRLQQIFINLLSNAFKFTKAGGIRMRLTREDQAFQVEVLDTGRGIPEADLERIFDKFERVGAETEPGSGLGLPIARDIVELHHGRIWAESRPGQGSRFVVQLPIGQETALGRRDA
jgi:signal transduction histidine kinase